MRIAMIGLRGVPHSYSGVETAVEELGARLSTAGHDVTVYCMANRTEQKPSHHRGMKLIYIPTVRSKNLEMIIYCLIATVHAMFRSMDIVHFHAVGPASMTVLTRLGRVASVATIQGLDWTRDKWSSPARCYLRLSAWLATKYAHELICVSRALQGYFKRTYGRESSYIPNGATVAEFLPLDETAEKYGLQPKHYLLFVGRLVAEKRVNQLILAFRNIVSDFKLVIVGGATDAVDQHLRELCQGDPRVILTGPLHGSDLSRLYSNAAIFVLPSTVEGMSLALLEALSFHLPVLVSDIPANLEVISDGGERLGDTFRADDVADLTHQLNHILGNLSSSNEQAKSRALRLLQRYDWDRILDETLSVYQMAKRRI